MLKGLIVWVIMMVEFGLHIAPSKSIGECVEIAKLAEKYGFKYVWVADESPSSPFRDVFVTLTAVALNTKNIKVGTAICNPYTRHPALVAVAFLSLNDIAENRLVLGIGPGGSLTLSPLGIKMWKKPVGTVRSAVKVLRRLFIGENVDYDSGVFKLQGVKLFSTPKEIPIYVAARGPQMLSLVGEIADGALLSLPTPFLSYAIIHIKEGAQKASRSLTGIDIANSNMVSVSSDEEEAREQVKLKCAERIAFYNYPKNMLEASGIRKEEREMIRNALMKGEVEKAKDLVDRMIDLFAIAGSPEHCIKRCVDQIKEGVTQLCFGYPTGPDPEEALKVIGEEIIPRFSE